MAEKLDTNNLILALAFVAAVTALALAGAVEGAAVLAALVGVALPSPLRT